MRASHATHRASAQAAELALREMQARSDELRELERGTAELQQICVELATLVNDQGGAVDCIEVQVAAAADYVAAGAADVRTARTHQRAARRKRLWLILLVLAVVLAAIAAAVIAVGVIHPWG